jgi:type I restriction enzyme, S subunit
MSGWTKCLLGDVVTLKRGYDLPTRDRTDGDVPVVSSSGITGCHGVAKVQGPGVVTGRYGTLGNVFYITRNFWPLNTTLYVEDFKGNHPRFVAYLLKKLNLARHEGAAAVPGVNRNVLHGLAVERPPFEAQSRIAAILSSYDDLIENNSRRIAILEEVGWRVHEEFFVKFRFPGHKGISAIDSDVGTIPTGWRAASLAEVCAYIGRGISPRYDSNSQSRVINQRCIRNGRLSLKEARRHRTYVKPEKYVKTGDILINSTGIGTLGRVAQIRRELTDVTMDSHVTIARPGSIDHHFLGWTLLGLQEHFAHLGKGATGQTELARSDIAETSIVVPPDDLQKHFAALVQPIEAESEVLLQTNECLAAARDFLLPRLISRQIDVSELDIDTDEFEA